MNGKHVSGLLKFIGMVIITFAIMVACIAVNCGTFSYAEGEANSTLKTTTRTLNPGDTYTMDNKTDSVKVVINKSGEYWLKGSSNRTHVSISAGGSGGKAVVHLMDGLKITPGGLANIGKTTPGITIEDDGGTVELQTCKNAKTTVHGYLMSPGIQKHGINTRLEFTTEDESNPGELVVKAAGGDATSPGIGATCYGLRDGCYRTVGNVYFESGIVEAHGTNSPGIGSGTRRMHSLVFNGGTIKSYGTGNGAGIGGGDTCRLGTITINGGNITAISNNGAGIGGGKMGKFSNYGIDCITINGGTVYAESKGGCAGIGSGSDTFTEKIVINGGNITAKTSGAIDIMFGIKDHGGCAIGGTGRGNTSSRCKNIIITGGDITAISECTRGCGIGSGDVASGTNNITITGGTIKATGGEDGYAIGGVGRTNGGTLNVNISGGTIYPAEDGKKAIGTFGKSSNLHIKITGGSLYTTTGMESTPVNDAGEKVVMSYIGFSLLDAGSKAELTGITHNDKEYNYGCNDVYTRNYGGPLTSFTGSYVYAWLPEEDTTIISKGTATVDNKVKRYSGKISSLDRSPAGEGAIVGELSQTQLVTLKKPFDDYGEDGSVYCGYLWDKGDDLTAPDIKEGYTITGYSVKDVVYEQEKWKKIMSADGSFEKSVRCDKDNCDFTDSAGRWYYTWRKDLEFRTDYRVNTYSVEYDANVPDNATTEVSGVIDLNGYTVDTSKKTIASSTGIKYNEKINISTECFYLPGYAFAGWNTEADGSGTHYATNQEVEGLTAEDGGEVTLYAEWKPLEYTVSFEKGGETGETVSGEMSAETMQFDTSQALNSLAYTNDKRSAFAGWKRTLSTGDKLYADKAEVENLIQDTDTLDDKWARAYRSAATNSGGTYPTYDSVYSSYAKPDLSLTAQWLTAATFTACVTLDDVVKGGIPIQLRDQSNPSTIIGYFVTDENGIASSSRGKRRLEDETTENIDVPAGCYDILTGGGHETGLVWDSTSGKQPGTVFLQYYNYSYARSIDPKIHKDAFITDVGKSEDHYKFPTLESGSATSPFGISVDEDHITLKNNAIKVYCPIDAESYVPYNTFNRWNSLGVDPEYVSGYTAASNEAKINIQGTTVFKAESRPIQYSIKFDGNGATSGSMVTISNCIYGEKYDLPENCFDRKGYYFSGWSTSKNGEKKYNDDAEVSNLCTVEGGTATLYAVWEPYDYTVNFESNGADTEIESMLCRYGTKVSLPKCNLNYTDYTFLGWNTDPGSDEVIYKDCAETLNFSELEGLEITDGCEIKLYAVWTDQYTVVYDANGGSGNMYDDVGYCGSKIVPADCEFTRTGYTFKEWNTKADGSGKSYSPETEYDSIAKGGDTVKLYAIWTDNTTETGKTDKKSGVGTGDDNNPMLCLIIAELSAAAVMFVLAYRRRHRRDN